MYHRLRFEAKFALLQAIRDFFRERSFDDVLTPPLVPHPGMEAHLHPFEVKGLGPYPTPPRFLHTSPEFAMKELLAMGYQKIFSLSHSFRHEPDSRHHRPQFLMLEWYRSGERYESIMQDVEELIHSCAKRLQSPEFKLVHKTVQEIFWEVLNMDILEYLEAPALLKYLSENRLGVPLPPSSEWPKLRWDDLFFLLFLNKIEPVMRASYPALLLKEYPHHLSALSTLKPEDPRVCERFEVYLQGIELCNCYNELTDLSAHRQRFAEQDKLKRELYGRGLGEPEVLYQALQKGMPPSSGVALGVERLLMGLRPDLPEAEIFWDWGN